MVQRLVEKTADEKDHGSVGWKVGQLGLMLGNLLVILKVRSMDEKLVGWTV